MLKSNESIVLIIISSIIVGRRFKSTEFDLEIHGLMSHPSGYDLTAILMILIVSWDNYSIVSDDTAN